MTGGRAAHFLLSPVLSNSPPNEALISAYLELGLEVDLYAPGGTCDVEAYGGRVTCHDVSYGRRWLARNVWKPAWRRYSLFSGTSESPLGVVGALAFVTRRPSIALVDEIRSGSYRGNEAESWKRLCRFGMRHASFDIVNDDSRVELLRDYAGLAAKKEVLVYPGGFRDPPRPVDRDAQRRQWGVSNDALVVGYSGVIDIYSGADWLIAAMRCSSSFHVVMQAVDVNPLAGFLLGQIEGRDRMYVQKQRLGWREAWSQAAAMDIGVVIYNNPGPQFQRMGIVLEPALHVSRDGRAGDRQQAGQLPLHRRVRLRCAGRWSRGVRCGGQSNRPAAAGDARECANLLARVRGDR